MASTVRYNGQEAYSYDRIGNITTLLRDTIGNTGDITMAYNYVAGTNKLASLWRPTGTSTYSYDLAGNMVNDQYQDINTIQYGAYLSYALTDQSGYTDNIFYNRANRKPINSKKVLLNYFYVPSLRTWKETKK